MPHGTKSIPGPLSRSIGSIVRARMARLDVTASQLSAHLGLSEAQVSRILRAARHMDVEQLHAICVFLKLSMPEVLREALAEVGTSSPDPAPAAVPADAACDPQTTLRRLRLAASLLLPGDAEAFGAALGPALRAPAGSARLAAVPASPGPHIDPRVLAQLAHLAASLLDVPEEYFTTTDAAEVRRTEAVMGLARAMSEAGVSKVAARSLRELPAETVEQITKVVQRDTATGER